MGVAVEGRQLHGWTCCAFAIGHLTSTIEVAILHLARRLHGGPRAASRSSMAARCADWTGEHRRNDQVTAQTGNCQCANMGLENVSDGTNFKEASSPSAPTRRPRPQSGAPTSSRLWQWLSQMVVPDE